MTNRLHSFQIFQSVATMPTYSKYNFDDYDVEPFQHNKPPPPAKNIKGLEFLIPVINKLRDVFDRTGGSASAIQLPQIVVVGSQVSVREAKCNVNTLQHYTRNSFDFLITELRQKQCAGESCRAVVFTSGRRHRDALSYCLELGQH